MRMMTKRTAAGTVLGGSLLFTGAMGIASAAPTGDINDGLVNLGVGNNNLLTDVKTDVASQVASLICGDAAMTSDLSMKTTQVDAGTATDASCNSAQGTVTISQNGTTSAATPQNAPANPAAVPAAVPDQPNSADQPNATGLGSTEAQGQAPAVPAPVTPIG
jgi:hypothetical protein